MTKLMMAGAVMTFCLRAMADYSYAEDNLANRAPVPVAGQRSVVEAELTRATATGELIGLHGVPMNRISPRAFPPPPIVVGRTRAEVREELAMAIQDGDMLAANETGLALNQLSPTFYAKADGSTRTEVMAGDAEDPALQTQPAS